MYVIAKNAFFHYLSLINGQWLQYSNEPLPKALPNNLVHSKGCDWMTNVSHNQQEFAQTSSSYPLFTVMVCTIKEFEFSVFVQSEYLITLHHLKTTPSCQILLSPKCSVTSKY